MGDFVNQAEPTRGQRGDPEQTGPESTPVRLQDGDQFGRYRIVRKLGSGGMGNVYLAVDQQLDRTVALKIPNLGSKKNKDHRLERFYREAKAAASLSHPNLCPVYDVGQHDNTHYLVMGHVDGASLSTLLKKGRKFSHRQAAMLIRRLAQAMAVAHQAGVIHRDLKPSNIVVDKSGNPVIVDFGLAWREHPNDSRITKHGAAVGTPAFMSPEQIQHGMQATGIATDIYSLGVTLYVVLTGRLPFSGPVPGVYVTIVNEEPKPLRERDPSIPEVLERICQKAMAKEPANRFASMTEFAKALGSFLQQAEAGPTTSRTEPNEGPAFEEDTTTDLGTHTTVVPMTPKPVAKTASTNRPAWGKLATVAVGLTLGGWFAYVNRQPATAPPTQAPQNAAQQEVASQPAEQQPSPAAETPLVETQAQDIHVNIVPPDAKLSSDSSSVQIEGTGPTRRLRVPATIKEFSLRAEFEGFESQQRTVELAKFADRALTIELAAVPKEIPAAPAPPADKLTSPPVDKPSTPPEPILTPEEILANSDLVRLSQQYVLSNESEFLEKYRGLGPIQAALQKARERLAEVEKREAEREKQIFVSQRQWHELERSQEKAQRTGDARGYNQVVNWRNELATFIKKLQGERDDRALQAAREEVVRTNTTYQEHLLELRQLAESIASRYEWLQSNSAIQEALADLNAKENTSFTVEPSRNYLKHLRQLEDLESQSLKWAVPIRLEDGKRLVEVRLNDKISVEMEYDPSSTWTLIPPPLAGRLGLRPTGADPTVTITLPDQSQHQGVKMRLQSVRVGPGVATDIECVVLPEAFESSRPRLGAGFFRHFLTWQDGERLVLQPLDESPANEKMLIKPDRAK